MILESTNHYLPCKLEGERILLPLLTSSYAPGPSTHRALLLTLISELALLLVAIGESETLRVLLLFGPDLIKDAGISERRLPGTVRLISMCLMAISKDFFERFLPKPELSGDEDFPDKFLRGESLSSCLGGTSFRIFITLSTILLPMRTGLTLSLALTCNLVIAGTGTELPLL